MKEVINYTFDKEGKHMNVMDQLLAFHCAPTLYGLKPANLISHAAKDDFLYKEDYFSAIEALKEKDIYIERLCGCERKRLTLVYRKNMMEAHLNQPQIWGYLAAQGYPMYGGLDAIFKHLKLRVIQSGGFPHEIGVFLGYPLEDVVGFIRNKGQNCKLCGYWKVYGDVNEAQHLFERFNVCRDEIMCALKNGAEIHQCVEVA